MIWSRRFLSRTDTHLELLNDRSVSELSKETSHPLQSSLRRKTDDSLQNSFQSFHEALKEKQQR